MGPKEHGWLLGLYLETRYTHGRQSVDGKTTGSKAGKMYSRQMCVATWHLSGAALIGNLKWKEGETLC